MRRVTLAGAAIIGALLLAIPSAFARTDLVAAEPGITATSDRDRRHVPADRAGIELCADPGRDEGVLQLHQRPARSRQEARDRWSADRLEVLRRRLQPGQLGPAAAEARRAGQGLRRRGHARHRGQPGGAAVPERAEGAARPRLDRCQRVRQGRQEAARGRSAGSRTTSPRPGSTGSTSRRTIRTRRSRSSTRTTATGRTTCTASSRRSARRSPTSWSSASRRSTCSAAPRRASQLARLKASGADTLMIFVTPGSDDPDVRDHQGAGLAAGADLRQLGLGDRHVHGDRGQKLERRDGERLDQRRVPQGSRHRRPGRTTRR